jgi:hypothetical protein
MTPMPICDPLIEPACVAIGQAAHNVASSAGTDLLSGLAQAIEDGVRWIVENTATWWIKIPSPDLTAEPAVTRMQQWLLPITAAVAVGGVIAAGARMALTRKANPLLDVTGGLLALAAASTIGVAATTLLLKAGDAWANWVLRVSTGGQFAQRLATAFDLGGNAAPAVVLVFGVIAIVLSIVQAALMLFRQAALVILAGTLPLAAAGSIAPLTRTWVRKVAAWMLALICYKPAAAAVYAAAFTMIGSGGNAQTFVMGFVMLALSVLALPALLRLFTWTTGAIGSSMGGGQILGAAAAGAFAVGALRSRGGGSAAADQAAYLNDRLGPPPGGAPDAALGSPPPDPIAPTPPGFSRPPSGAPAIGASALASRPAAAGPAATTHVANPAAASGAAPAAGAGPAAAGAGVGPAAGPAGAAFAAGAQATQASARRAADAMHPEDQQ